MKTRSTQLLSLCLILLLVAFSATACSKRKATKEWQTSGHADTTSQAFRHWDNASNDDATVAAACASCHSTVGFTEYLTTGNRTIAQPPLATADNGITCDACHSTEADATTDVTFTASGETVANAGTAARLCGQCHQGRSYYGTVDAAIKKAFANDNASTTDKISSKINVNSIQTHYLASFAAIKASKSHFGYNYGSTLIEVDSPHAAGTDCSFCHNPMSTAVDVGKNGKNCQPCHSYTTAADIPTDPVVAPKKQTLDTQATELLRVIQAYAADNTTKDADNNTKAKACIAYDDGTYPYWFKDSNCDGTADNATATYASFTPRLAKACYNYFVYTKSDGLYAHNPTYGTAVLTASIVNIKLYKNY